MDEHDGPDRVRQQRAAAAQDGQVNATRFQHRLRTRPVKPALSAHGTQPEPADGCGHHQHGQGGEPGLDPRFRAQYNVVSQPHYMAVTWEARAEMAATLLAAIDRHFAGGG